MLWLLYTQPKQVSVFRGLSPPNSAHRRLFSMACPRRIPLAGIDGSPGGGQTRSTESLMSVNPAGGVGQPNCRGRSTEKPKSVDRGTPSRSTESPKSVNRKRQGGREPTTRASLYLSANSLPTEVFIIWQLNTQPNIRCAFSRVCPRRIPLQNLSVGAVP